MTSKRLLSQMEELSLALNFKKKEGQMEMSIGTILLYSINKGTSGNLKKSFFDESKKAPRAEPQFMGDK